MRIIDSHMVNPANDKLLITVDDQPGAGGAHHLYVIAGFDASKNPSCPVMNYSGGNAHSGHSLTVLFQNGPIAEVGVNGVTHEALLAILIDRLQCFQKGPYACSENALALESLEEAQKMLLSRTRARMARGVEGTHKI